MLGHLGHLGNEVGQIFKLFAHLGEALLGLATRLGFRIGGSARLANVVELALQPPPLGHQVVGQ